MHSRFITRTIAVAAGLAAALGGAAGTAAATAAPGSTGTSHAPGIKHVLLMTILRLLDSRRARSRPSSARAGESCLACNHPS